MPTRLIVMGAEVTGGSSPGAISGIGRRDGPRITPGAVPVGTLSAMGTTGSAAPAPSTDGGAPPPRLADIAAPWPPAVRAAMARLASADLALEGPLPVGALDLGRREDRATVLAVATELRRPPHLRAPLPFEPASVPVMVSWGGFAAVPDLVLLLEGVRALLVPEGVLRFVEPAGRPGVRALVRSTIDARRPELRDAHLGRDLTAALRAGGLVVDSVQRSVVPGRTVPGLLRDLAYGRAVSIPDRLTDPLLAASNAKEDSR